MALPKTEEDRRLLASILMHEEEELTPETVEGAVRALRRIYLRRRLEEVQRALQRPGLSMAEKQALLQEKVRLKRALMDPRTGREPQAARRPKIGTKPGRAPSKELAGKEIRAAER